MALGNEGQCMTYKRLPNGHWPSFYDPPPPRTWHEHLRCNMITSFRDSLMEDETLRHIHLGEVQYTEACMAMDKIAGERYRVHVDTGDEMIKVSLHKLIRKDNQGNWTVRMCHNNPDWEFRKKHFWHPDWYHVTRRHGSVVWSKHLVVVTLCHHCSGMSCSSSMNHQESLTRQLMVFDEISQKSIKF